MAWWLRRPPREPPASASGDPVTSSEWQAIATRLDLPLFSTLVILHRAAPRAVDPGFDSRLATWVPIVTKLVILHRAAPRAADPGFDSRLATWVPIVTTLVILHRAASRVARPGLFSRLATWLPLFSTIGNTRPCRLESGGSGVRFKASHLSTYFCTLVILEHAASRAADPCGARFKASHLTTTF